MPSLCRIHVYPYGTQVLGCAGGGTSDETDIVVYHEDDTANQQWYVESVTYNSQTCLHFPNYNASDKALDTNNGDGNPAWLWDDDGNSNGNQCFLWQADSNYSGYYNLVRASDGHYLTYSGTTDNSGLTCQSSYSGSANQQFSLEFTSLALHDGIPEGTAMTAKAKGSHGKHAKPKAKAPHQNAKTKGKTAQKARPKAAKMTMKPTAAKKSMKGG